MNKLLLTVLGTTLAVLAEAKGSSGGGGGGSEVKVSATDDGGNESGRRETKPRFAPFSYHTSI